MSESVRIKSMPEVSTALDDYAKAIREWGIKVNHPRFVISAEDRLIDTIARALEAKP